MDVSAWVAAGLYQPDAADADARLALLEYLTSRGATIDQMVEAHRHGGLPGVAGDLAVPAPPETLAPAELAAECGIPTEQLERILLAAGLPVDAESRLPDDLRDVVASFDAGAALLGEESVLAFTRVLGGAAANIAEAAIALFYAELGPGTPGEGSDELARARVSEQATLAFAAVPDALSRLVLAHFDRGRRRALVTRGWSLAPAAGPTEVVCLGFVDLVGSTAWAERIGLRDQSLALSRFESAAWSSAVKNGGRVVKMIGDEVFFTGPSPDAACRIASEVCLATARDPVLPDARAAVGRGPVTPREGDYFGSLVNVVARLVKTAPVGGLVVTVDVADALTSDRWICEQLEPQELRGIEQPVPAAVVVPVDARLRGIRDEGRP
jgi:adenylate cyclase